MAVGKYGPLDHFVSLLWWHVHSSERVIFGASEPPEHIPCLAKYLSRKL